MRVSSGVRNLIAGGNGGGGGGDGGAESVPAASPPPAPAETGAATESVTGTLAAGRRAVEAPATTLDAADGLTGARRVPLEELVDSVDARGAEDMGEAGAVVRAENLPELTRSADTAEQLGALQETLRIDGASSGSETAGGFRASELEGAVSMHPAGGGRGPLEIESPSAVHGEKASMVRPLPRVPWGQGPETELGLLGGADRPPRSTMQESDVPAVYRRLRNLKHHYNVLSRADIAREFDRAIRRTSRRVVRQFVMFGGNTEELTKRQLGITRADQAYDALQETARQAERDGDFVRAGTIREALDALDTQAVEELQALTARHGMARAPSTQAMPPPAHTPTQFDWITAFRQLRDLTHQFLEARWDRVHADFQTATRRVAQSAMYRFGKLGGQPERLLATSRGTAKAEQAYRAIQEMARQAAESGDVMRADKIRDDLKLINRTVTREMQKLTTKHGVLDALSTQATQAIQTKRSAQSMGTIQTIQTTQITQTLQTLLAILGVQLPPVRVGPTTSAALPVTVAPATVAVAGRLDIPGPAHPTALAANPAFSEPAGGLAHTTDVPGPPPASGLPGPSPSEAGGVGRSRLDPLATVPGTTPAHPAATETTVTPALGGTSSFWLQPVDPAPAPGSVPFDTGVQHTGETVRPPPVTTTVSSTAPAPVAALPPLRGWTTTSPSSAPSSQACSPRGSMRRGSSSRPDCSPSSGSPGNSPRAGSPDRPSMV